jgi:Flp pilus assembly protein TadG
MKRFTSSRQAGSTAVEFALVLLIFLTFFLGITDFARMLFTWSAATEATRAGARYAVVCDDRDQKAAVLARMQQMLPQISDISLVWEDVDGVENSCSPEDCTGVTVTIVGLNYQWISPVAGLARIGAIPMPTFSTYLTREIMGQDTNSYAGANICS